MPPEVTFLVSAFEIGGVIAVFAGIMTRITAALYNILMLATTSVVKLSRGCMGCFEVHLLLGHGSQLFIAGLGRISIELDVLKGGDMTEGEGALSERSSRFVKNDDSWHLIASKIVKGCPTTR